MKFGRSIGFATLFLIITINISAASCEKSIEIIKPNGEIYLIAFTSYDGVIINYL